MYVSADHAASTLSVGNDNKNEGKKERNTYKKKNKKATKKKKPKCFNKRVVRCVVFCVN